MMTWKDEKYSILFRSWAVRPEIRDLRYQHYEEKRKQFIATLLQKIDESSNDIQKSINHKQLRKTTMISKVASVLEKQQTRYDKMLAARAKYEQVNTKA